MGSSLNSKRKLTLKINPSIQLEDDFLLDSRPNMDKSEINEKNK